MGEQPAAYAGAAPAAPAPETQYLPPYPTSEPGSGVPPQSYGGQQTFGGQTYGGQQSHDGGPGLDHRTTVLGRTPPAAGAGRGRDGPRAPW